MFQLCSVMLLDIKQSSALFIAHGMTIVMAMMQAAAMSVGGATWMDASSLLQASVQQPWVQWAGMQQPYTPSPWIKIKQVESDNSPRWLDDLNVGLNKKPSFDIEEYNETEWDLDTRGSVDGTVSNPNAGENNLCYFDHLIPEFILIGVVKAGTTSFAADMRQSPGIMFPRTCKGEFQTGEGFCDNNTAKEGHFFDHNRLRGLFYVKTLFPKCRRDVRLVATDMSPRYMMDHRVPKTIQTWYTHRAKQIKFIVILRDPISRFHSDYYHAKAQKWCPKYTNTTFAEIVSSIVLGNDWNSYVGGQEHCTDRLEGSLYTAAMKRWFYFFMPSQFIIVPFLFLTNPEERISESIVEVVWNILGVDHGVPRKDSHFNTHDHPVLSQDIDQNLLEQFKRLIWLENGPSQLASTLVEQRGAMLLGYTGNETNINAIENWLQENW